MYDKKQHTFKVVPHKFQLFRQLQFFFAFDFCWFWLVQTELLILELVKYCKLHYKVEWTSLLSSYFLLDTFFVKVNYS